MEKKTLEMNLFTWEGWDEQDTMSFSFYKVEFVRDFGVFRKGEKFPDIFYSFDTGIIEAYGYDGIPVKKQRFTLTPIEEPTDD